MGSEYSIEVEQVKKSFKIYMDKRQTLKEKVIFKNRNRYEERQVLKGISFKVKKGEAVGLIGSNGCGKSTTLKLLTRIIFPDEGRIIVNGRISSLLELGAGFHPDMSGRENIYTNASIFGLKKTEIDVRLQGIIDFSELGEFIDNPVRTYSSGMYMRLAFSVAINVDADILLIDEILAVGDVNFQKKCIEKIKEIREKGTTIVIVSHSLSQIESICDKTIWLENGLVKEVGVPKDVHQQYQDEMEYRRLEKIRRELAATSDRIPSLQFDRLTIEGGNKRIAFDKVWLTDDGGNGAKAFNIGDTIVIRANYHCELPDLNGILSFSIARNDGTLCYATNSDIQLEQLVTFQREGTLAISLEKCNLMQGQYSLNIAVTSADGIVYDDLQRVLFFQVCSQKQDLGIIKLKTSWSIE